MSGPLIYLSTWRIKEGRLEEFKQFSRELINVVESKEPQLIGYNIFLSEDESEVTVMHIHPDGASMDFHMQVLQQALGEEVRDWVERADFLEPKHIEIYGTPSAALLEGDRPLVESGIPRHIKPRHMDGFTRLPA
jgi:hypothetical protein